MPQRQQFAISAWGSVTVYLRQSRHAAAVPDGLPWLAVTGTTSPLAREVRLAGVARRLEAAFVESRDTWWQLGRAMSEDPSAEVSHTAACGAFGSDFGLMLAWSRLIEELIVEKTRCLVLCDDPWLFRHLAGLAGVAAGPAPSLILPEWKLNVRGLAARVHLVTRLIAAWAKTRAFRPMHRPGASVILVYGHPSSDERGFDTYFGPLMVEIPTVQRLLHTDCPPSRTRELAADGRTASLHAWGNPLSTLRLPAERWTPRPGLQQGPYGWLIRRAAVRENGGGGPAMNRWQIHCQGRWLSAIKPRAVAWPWENHAWERAFCRQARANDVRTIGYQHTVIGRHQINYAVHSNPDGLMSIPDEVVADGPAYRDEMAAWGIPAERMRIGGAFRFDPAVRDIYDPVGPVFVPLSPIPAIAALQVEAARTIAASGRQVLVKDHPMYPFAFAETDKLNRAEAPLARQTGLSAVVYATGTSGLEALLAGVPALRLLAEDQLSIDVLPLSMSAIGVELDSLLPALADARRPRPVAWADILSAVDWGLWRELLGDAKHVYDETARKSA